MIKNKKKQYLFIDLDTNEVTIMNPNEAKRAIRGVDQMEGDVRAWRAESYIVVEANK